MTGREWKPGDVAMVRSRTYPDDIPDQPRIFGYQDRWYGSSGYLDPLGAIVLRPLVVIDPEDREQVERLRTALYRHGMYVGGDQLPTALRSLDTPPKPDEPTGLGAVVLTADEPFVKTAEGQGGWQSMSGHEWAWDDIAAVKVLSEGVNP